MKMRALGISIISLILTAAVVSNAYYQKKQFYPSVVYITKTNASMAVIYVQAFILVMLAGKLMRKVFFGQLRAAEFEHLMERSWYAVTETCLAFTVFRDDFNPKFVALFTVLLFLKSFHWLAEDRVDYMERSPVISWLFHIRVLGLLTLLGMLDVYFLSSAYYSTVTKGASVQLVFGFEYAILLTMVANTAIKYCLHAADLRSESPWDGKAVLLLYSELVVGFLRVLLYLAFVAIMVRIYTLPLFAFRPMYYTMRNFKKAFNDVILSRRAIRNMNTLYPDATSQELSDADNVCIICREEMTSNAKKLPCNHIFHTACLRSWFQRQQTCPTCRLDILRPPAAASAQTTPAAQNAPNAQPAQANQPGANNQQGPGVRNQTQTAAGNAAPNTFPNPPFTLPNLTNLPGMPPMPPMPPMPSMPNLGAFPIPPLGSWFTPPPPPPRDLAALSDEELRAMEGHERSNVEARIKYIREIQLMLDTSIALMQNYHMITSRLPPFPTETVRPDATKNENIDKKIPNTHTANMSDPEPGPSTSTSKQINPSSKEMNSNSSTHVADALASAVASGPNDELRRRRLRRFENNE